MKTILLFIFITLTLHAHGGMMFPIWVVILFMLIPLLLLSIAYVGISYYIITHRWKPKREFFKKSGILFLFFILLEIFNRIIASSLFIRAFNPVYFDVYEYTALIVLLFISAWIVHKYIKDSLGNSISYKKALLLLGLIHILWFIFSIFTAIL